MDHIITNNSLLTLFLRILLRKYRKWQQLKNNIILGNIYGIYKLENEIYRNQWMGYKIVGWFGQNN